MENVVVKYSELVQDDGGFSKIKNDFTKLGDELVAEAIKVKKEFNAAFTLDNPELVTKYEAQAAKLNKVNDAYQRAKRDLIAVEKAHEEAVKSNTQAEIAAERAKQEKLKTMGAELRAESELNKAIIAETNSQKSQIALSEAQRRQREAAEKTIIKEKDAYGQLSAELNKLFRASASVAVEMYRLEEAGKKTSPEYARLSSEFNALQGRTVKLDKALKDIDKSLGRNQRNVGNYQFDALGNSIQQILREAPSAAVSLNTFFLAISNNLPTFFDAITGIGGELKELKNAAADLTAQLTAQQAVQQAASAVSQEAEETLATQVESTISSIAASQEQAIAIREQVVAQLTEIETTGAASAATITNTETTLLNAGATIDQVAAIDAQITATAAATSVTSAATSAEVGLTAAVTAANTSLATQPGLLRRISTSLFSVNTALTIGVLALTLWGGKIVDAIGNLIGLNKELESVKESQEALSKAQLEGLKATVADERALRSNLKISQDKKLSDEEREIALKKLRAQYPFYFKNLTDEQILLGKTAQAEAEVIKALEKRSEAEKANTQIIKNRQRIIELNEQQVKSAKELEKANKRVSDAESLNLGERSRGDLITRALLLQSEVREGIQDTQEEINKLNEQNLTYEDKILKLQKESIGLDYKEEKSSRGKLANQIKTVDYLASEFELARTILDNNIQNNREIFDSDKYTLEQRLAAREKFLQQSKDLAKLEREEELRDIRRTYEEERKETIKSSDGKTQVLKYTQQGLRELALQYQYDTKKAEEDFQQKLRNIEKESGDLSQLNQLQLQLQKLEHDREYFSKSFEMYSAYTKEISRLQNDINKIINPLAGLELSNQIGISDAEINRIRELRGELDRLLNGRQLSDLNPFERKSLLKKIEEFEKKRSKSEANYDTQRKLARKHSIEEEQKQFEQDTNEFKQLETERQAIILDLENKAIDDMLNAQKEKAEKFKEFLSEVNNIVGAILDRMIEITQKRIEQSEKMVDNQSKKVEDQTERAQNGLKNTLAFEQEQLAKREAELVKQQKREQRLQKIKSLYSAYAGYADKDPDTAIVKALRDFAILESITASFKEGGIVGKDGYDHVRTDRGLTLGGSHNRNGGILAYHQGGEGFFSRNAVNNMGMDNFYKMRELAESGKLDSNFFSQQRQNFDNIVAIPVSNNQDIVNELQDVKRAIENQPVPNWELEKITEAGMELVKKTVTKNKVVRNHYKINKPRL